MMRVKKMKKCKKILFVGDAPYDIINMHYPTALF